MTTDTSERGLERLICTTLAGHPCELRAISEKANAPDSAVGRAATEIDLLREYRTRLIADVVTGKLDVREAAAALPEIDPLVDDDEANVPLDAAAAESAFDDERKPVETAD